MKYITKAPRFDTAQKQDALNPIRQCTARVFAPTLTAPCTVYIPGSETNGKPQSVDRTIRCPSLTRLVDENGQPCCDAH